MSDSGLRKQNYPDAREIARYQKKARKKEGESSKSASFTPRPDDSIKINWSDKESNTESGSKPSAAKNIARSIAYSDHESTTAADAPRKPRSYPPRVQGKPRTGSETAPQPAIPKNLGRVPVSANRKAPQTPSTPSVTVKNSPKSQERTKSFDTHANEAIAIANSPKTSFREHENSAMSVANSGRTSTSGARSYNPRVNEASRPKHKQDKLEQLMSSTTEKPPARPGLSISSAAKNAGQKINNKLADKPGDSRAKRGAKYVGRDAVDAAKGVGKVMYEGTRDIAKAEVTGVKRIAGRAKKELGPKIRSLSNRLDSMGRAPEPQDTNRHPATNNEQFKSYDKEN
jgi:hypothetical protein